MTNQTSDRPKSGVEKGEALIEALRHPFRVETLHVANQRMVSPKEMTLRVGGDCTVSTMAYHFRVLEELGFIELVRTEPRRGATEHFYRGTGQAIFSEDEWVQVPEPIRAAAVGLELKVTGKALSRSLGTGTFEKRASRHHSFHQALVDEEGWGEAMAVLEEAMLKVIEVERASAERRLESSERGIPLAVSLLGFERAPERD